MGDRLVGQFATCLSERLTEPAQGAPAAEEEPDQSLDLLRTAGVPVAKRAGAALAGAVAAAGVVLVLVRLLRGRRARRR
ncbi:hypothetical protein [Streptomyces sp. NBC_00443]|uniref:hypothetical protein n=1 Tax=Streptomyces sp. NBC_00443 TaxID=2975743 RepID=UPI003FA7693C